MRVVVGEGATRRMFVARGRPKTDDGGAGDLSGGGGRGVEDDGLGFGAGNGGVGDVGMRAMKERAALLGGALRVSSRPDAGRKKEVSVPLAEEDVR